MWSISRSLLTLVFLYKHKNSYYLRQGGYVFASVSLCVWVCVCLCVINITQKVTDQCLRKF